MELKLLVLGVLVLLVLGHRLFGARVARRLGLDDGRRTPAHAKRDGVDFVPTPPFYLFAQHFSAIAAAGPIAGPILAAQQYGWLPCLLWIGVGVVFIGAVHDMTTLVASLRHGGESIAAMARQRLGTGARADVRAIGDGLAAGLCNLCHHLSRTCSIDIVHQHARAMLGQQQRMRPADAATGTRHHSHARVQEFHSPKTSAAMRSFR